VFKFKIRVNVRSFLTSYIYVNFHYYFRFGVVEKIFVLIIKSDFKNGENRQKVQCKKFLDGKCTNGCFFIDSRVFIRYSKKN